MSLREVVSDVWADVLERDDIVDDSDFFEVGGESLSAVEIAGRLSDELGRSVDVSAVFNYPTITLLAQHIDQLGESDRMALPDQ